MELGTLAVLSQNYWIIHCCSCSNTSKSTAQVRWVVFFFCFHPWIYWLILMKAPLLFALIVAENTCKIFFLVWTQITSNVALLSGSGEHNQARMFRLKEEQLFEVKTDVQLSSCLKNNMGNNLTCILYEIDGKYWRMELSWSHVWRNAHRNTVENLKVQAYQKVAKNNTELNILPNMTWGYWLCCCEKFVCMWILPCAKELTESCQLLNFGNRLMFFSLQTPPLGL